MGDNEVRHASKEYTCHDCSEVIRVGDLYYNRYLDFTTLCMACFEERKRKWVRIRDTSGKEQELLGLLRYRPQGAGELREKLGNRYMGLIRKLKMKGHAIYRTPGRGNQVVFVLDEGSALARCADCGRSFWADMVGNPPHSQTLCGSCLRGRGVRMG